MDSSPVIVPSRKYAIRYVCTVFSYLSHQFAHAASCLTQGHSDECFVLKQ